MLLSLVAILAGFTLLIAGGELLVSGATRLANRLNISPILIGLTIVAFGTSAPELGVSLQAAWTGACPSSGLADASRVWKAA